MSYYDESSLEVTVLRPKKQRVTFKLTTAEQWDELWSLEHPVRSVRDVEPEQRKPTVFKLTFVDVPGGRRAKLEDLTMQASIDEARGQAGLAMDSTRTDRGQLDDRVKARSEKHEDNRRNGDWGKGRD